MIVARRFALVCLITAAAASPAGGQSACEAGVRQRLAAELGASPEQLLVSRNYSPGLFPGATFFRARLETGFHTRPKAATLVTYGADSLAVSDIADLPAVWRMLRQNSPLELSEVRFALPELLFLAGILEGGDRLVGSAGELSEGYRTFLSPLEDLAIIRPITSRMTPSGIDVDFFVQTSEGVAKFHAEAGQGGRLDLTRDVIAWYHPD